VRWDELFADLSGQGDADDAAVLAAEVADRSRWEAGQTTLNDRLRRRPGCWLEVGLPGGGRVDGPLLAVGRDWLAVGDGRTDCLVPAPALCWVRAPSVERAPVVAARGSAASVHRLRLVHAVRLLARDRAYVRVRLAGGVSVCGTVDRAGADHLDLAEHPPDVPRRASAVRSTVLLPYAALTCVRGGQVWSAP